MQVDFILTSERELPRNAVENEMHAHFNAVGMVVDGFKYIGKKVVFGQAQVQHFFKCKINEKI